DQRKDRPPYDGEKLRVVVANKRRQRLFRDSVVPNGEIRGPREFCPNRAEVGYIAGIDAASPILERARDVIVLMRRFENDPCEGHVVRLAERREIRFEDCAPRNADFASAELSNGTARRG